MPLPAAALLLLALAGSAAAGRPQFPGGAAAAAEQAAILKAARTEVGACGVLLENVDLFDADLEGGVVEDAGDIDDCCAACRETKGCGAFTYDSGMQR